MQSFLWQSVMTAVLGLCSSAFLMAETPGSNSFFLRTSTYAGYANVLRVGISSDGTNFTDLFTTPVMSNYSRDASVTRYGNSYIAAFTDAFKSTNGTFGIAVSTNLVHWSQVSSPRVSSPTLITNTINNTWAPEWFVENGEYYIVIRVSLTTSNAPNDSDTLRAPGHGYTRCLDPGTWTNWTEFQQIGGFTNTDANDVAIEKFGGTYHLFYTDQGDLKVRKSTNGPFSGYGEASNISSGFESVIDAAERNLFPPPYNYVYAAYPFEGPFVLHLGGDNYRLYFQNLINDRSWTILSTNGMASWETNSAQPLTYNSLPSFGHGSVINISSTEALLAVAGSRARAEDAIAEKAAIRTNPSAYGLYSGLQFTNNRFAGQADVTSSPASFGLYNSNAIMDLNLGGLMLQRLGSSAMVNLQVQTSTNLSHGFTNSPTNISFPIDLPGDKHFLRIRALGGQ